MRIAAVLVLIFSTLEVFSQDTEIFLSRLKRTYSSIESLHAKMEVIQGDSSDELEVLYDSKNSRLISKKMEMLNTEKFYLIVDKESREMHLQELSEQNIPIENPNQLPIDSLLAMSTKVHIDTTKSNAIVMKLLLDHPIIETMEITFNSKMMLISNHYWIQRSGAKKMKVEINYKIFEINPVLNKDIFAASHYLMENSNLEVPSSNFATYHLNRAPTYNLNSN